jgi:hypothetical protein
MKNKREKEAQNKIKKLKYFSFFFYSGATTFGRQNN